MVFSLSIKFLKRIKGFLLSYKSWITGTDAPKKFSNWDDLVFAVNKEYESTDDLKAIRNKLEISSYEVWESIGNKDWFDFYEEE